MLIKEYRIPLPLTKDEYKIAQLYMIAKKSRQESHGEGSGIEILVNEPYDNGPGPDEKGQYTRKLYHVGSHLPAWLKSLIPKSALSVEEEAWNAYPYTKTRYTCAFVEKFSIEVETYYFNDGGQQPNVFKLNSSDLKVREVDVIDIVNDQVCGSEYPEEEDPRKFVSQKTRRGPLDDNWIASYWNDCQGRRTPLPSGKAIMCAYKLCRVEFRYWGMQTKIERFIHEVALRKTMLRAHQQAWAWIDEWWGLTIEDIRNIEKDTQELLAQKYSKSGEDVEMHPLPEGENGEEEPLTRRLTTEVRVTHPDSSPDSGPRTRKKERTSEGVLGGSRTASKTALSSHSQASWRMESIRRDSVSSESGDEFFDCRENISECSSSALERWSSLDLLPNDPDEGPAIRQKESSVSYSERVTSRPPAERRSHSMGRYVAGGGPEASAPSSPNVSPSHHPSPCVTAILILVVHSGSVLDSCSDLTNKKNDFTTFRRSIDSVLRQHYPHLVGRVSVKLIPAPSICSNSLNIISSLAPYGLDFTVGTEAAFAEQIPVGALPILGTVSPEYEESLSKTISALNSAFFEFIASEEGFGFNGQICIIGDSIGGVLCYDALCRSQEALHQEDAEGEYPSIGEDYNFKEKAYSKSCSCEPFNVCDHSVAGRSVSDSDYHYMLRRQKVSSSGSVSDGCCSCALEFAVNNLFLFGCPLALVLVFRKLMSTEDKGRPMRPFCNQVVNLFHPSDPLALRLEPLLSARFSLITPITIPRYSKYPLGDGQPTHLLECIQSHGNLFCHSPSHRRGSDASVISDVSGIAETVSLATISALTQRWWGNKRLDYALFCPEGLSNFPSSALPHLFHASYWESCDVAAFIIRQLTRLGRASSEVGEDKDASVFLSSQPREKWQKKRTSVKIKNITANHRGFDAILKVDAPQTIRGRFMYGPLDVVALSGERVDAHVMMNPPTGDWKFVGTALTDKSGKFSLTIPEEKRVGHGIHPVKMIVRGDHTTCSHYLAVVPPKTECVVFSIDGSFTASVSVTGKDPKVRAGAVDVVRHWQELGYLILYITGRPDMQLQRVMSWLTQHNFPHGLLSFVDGLSTDPLGHKADYLRNIIQECEVVIEAAYGSAKDISVYTSIGLKSDQIYIVGKASKKQAAAAQILLDGYAAHLAELSSPSRSRPARSNPEILIPKGFFGLPGHTNALRRRSCIETCSLPFTTTSMNEFGQPKGQVPTQFWARNLMKVFWKPKDFLVTCTGLVTGVPSRRPQPFQFPRRKC